MSTKFVVKDLDNNVELLTTTNFLAAEKLCTHNVCQLSGQKTCLYKNNGFEFYYTSADKKVHYAIFEEEE